MKILIIEDDPDIADLLNESLRFEGFVVDLAFDGHEGSFMARTNTYDLIIIDYSIPRKDGLIVCSEIRSLGLTMPIIFLSATGDTKTKISALERGADDYLTKPFAFDELKARIRAITRRPRKIESTVLSVGELTIDTEKQSAYRDGTPIYLTRKEYCLLEYLMRNPGIILSRSMIMEHVWNAGSDPFSNTVEAHILNLRRKVNLGNKQELIRNIPGRGYVIEV
ncbi:MAG: response regulator transcription factor [Patescibacteria group bacterium]